MLSTARSRAARQLSRRALVPARRSYAFTAKDQAGINDPNKPKEVPNVSKTNEVATTSLDKEQDLKESVEKGEELRIAQAPNRAGTWSRSQIPRAQAMTGPRFEQTIMEYQVRSALYS